MTEEELTQIESHLGLKLPEFYRSTMLNYPFPVNSFADEFLLTNYLEQVLELNHQPVECSGIGRPFLVGSDGGEELYYIDLQNLESPVYTLQLETGKHFQKAENWTQYLHRIEADLKEIEDDEQREQERKASKRWWEFWK